ncbi:MAG: helix-turn-helix transcriptional regulator [Proteobacteria bacterium]|nr:helix-turn-helix transcriptional regulator [Pseudomonadota bacterium]
MSSDISPERLSGLIGLIYDCVLDPGRWQPTMDKLREALGFATAEIAVLRLPDGEPLMAAVSGIAPDWIQRFQEARAAGGVKLWGGPERLQDFPLAEPIVLTQAMGRDCLAGNPMHEQFGKPMGLSDLVSMALARDANGVAGVGLGWPAARGEIADAHIAPLRLLAPHLRRAVTILRLLDVQRLALSSFAQALDALASAVLLVDSSLAIVHANAAAEALLAARDALDAGAGRVLHLAAAASQTALADAVARMAASGTTFGQRGIGIPAPRRNGAAPLVVHVLPLQAGELRSGVSQRAVAAVFIADAAAPMPMPAQALALLYDLTPAEVRVFELIASGLAPAEAATRLGLAPSTVKTHLLRVFDKTGCRRQADLVRLAAALSA